MSRSIALILLLLTLCGCATAERTGNASPRKFDFQRDTFAFANELVWEYDMDLATGVTIPRKREPKPEYALHCFALVRSARQFFQTAQFDPKQPKAGVEMYRRLIRQIVRTNLRAWRQAGHVKQGSKLNIVIPAYPNLRDFSESEEQLLKENLGGAWRSYIQLGNWRMIFPFTRRHQDRTSQQLSQSLRSHGLPIVHLVRFPELTINHALLLFDAVETANGIEFTAYDPNNPTRPVKLVFDRGKRTFFLAANNYFAGGRVDVYEIYRGILY